MGYELGDIKDGDEVLERQVSMLPFIELVHDHCKSFSCFETTLLMMSYRGVAWLEYTPTQILCETLRFHVLSRALRWIAVSRICMSFAMQSKRHRTQRQNNSFSYAFKVDASSMFRVYQYQEEHGLY